MIRTLLIAATILMVSWGLTGSRGSWAFDSSGYIVNRVTYSNLGICMGIPEPLNTGGLSGAIRYIQPYLLCGTIENIGSNMEPGMVIRFTATNCAGDASAWSVIVSVGPLGPGESHLFNHRISYAPPGEPCHVTARAYKN